MMMIYRSRDIARSLDSTFAVFGINHNFVDEYLENRIFSGHAVFAGNSQTLCTTVFNKKMEVRFQKKSENHSKIHIFVLYG